MNTLSTQSVPAVYSQQSLLSSAFKQKQQLLRAFWFLVLTLTVGFVYSLVNNDLFDVICSLLITAAALIPVYFWCSGKAGGMPIYPLYSLTFLWTYAFPLLSNHPNIVIYDADDRLFASLVVASFLLLGTAAWFRFVQSAPRPLQHCLAMTELRGDRFFLVTLLFSILFSMATTGGWLQLSAGIFSLVRGIVLALNALSVFVLTYRWGAGQLSRITAMLVLLLVVIYALSSASSLLLVGSMTTFVLAVVAFSIGRGRIPWLAVVVVVLCFAALHTGKADIRKQYWYGKQNVAIQPWNYPALFTEWAGYSLDRLIGDEDRASGQSLFERASLMQLMVKVQDESPDNLPYMMGASYAIIPDLFIPRILKPDKIASHEGTYLLNIHYGMQTRLDTRSTTIGWGLLNEAYANFGLLGCAALAILLGAAYGKVANWSMNAPVLSLRALTALLFLSFSMQTEFTAGVYIAALFQSLVALGGVALIFMKRQNVASADRLE